MTIIIDEVRKGYFIPEQTWINIARSLLEHYSFTISSLTSYEMIPKGIESMFNVQTPHRSSSLVLNEISLGNIFQLGLYVVLWYIAIC
jgi:hypothetical protein